MLNGASRGIKLLTFATSIRWFGWGLGEALIPIFLLLFSKSFLETGLLASVLEVLFFLSIPIAGFLADRVKAKKMILTGLVMYVFIGLGYLLAGITGAVIFVILVRALNGISYSLDQVGRETYFLRHSPKSRVSRIFGHFDLITNFWWIIAVLIGIWLVKFMPIHWLLFFIAPTSLIAFLIILGLKEKPLKVKKEKFSIIEVYAKTFREIKNFNRGLRLVAILALFFGIIDSIVYFFVPISTYLGGESLANSVILILVYSMPGLFGDHLGRIADKHREKIYAVSLFLILLLLIGLIKFDNYFIVLTIMFLASVIFELISLTNKEMIARLSDRTHLGEVDGSLNGISSIGAMIGPVLFGFLIDWSSLDMAYSVIIGLTLIVSIVILARRNHFYK